MTLLILGVLDLVGRHGFGSRCNLIPSTTIGSLCDARLISVAIIRVAVERHFKADIGQSA